jgi:pyruvate dehydrogenase E2 component (dihydrolipoamide acetyltransferase)
VATVLRMPGVAANATEAVLAEWLVEESVDFAATDAIATLETEKAMVDVEAEQAGRVLKALVPAGAQVEVGEPIAVLGAVGEQVADLAALLASLGLTTAQVEEGTVAPTSKPEAESADGRVFSSPLARKLAKDAGLTLGEITGSGPRGRILRRDVDAAAAERTSSQPGRARVETVATPSPVEESARASVSRPEAAYEDIPHSRIRRITAARLTESKQTAPHFYLRATVRAEKLIALRAELNESATTKVSVNDLVVKAVAAAHGRVPEMNAVWTPDAVRRFATVDVAVAVATDRGLMTPVVRHVTSLTISALAAQVRDLADRARDGRLKQEELEGGSISVTNLGMYGVEEFAAIINPPHAAILAVGAVRDEPVIEDGAVVPGRVMTVTLSVDHRPVDGVLAAQWMAAFVELVEHPVRLLV